MTLQEYQSHAKRTMTELSFQSALLNAALGLTGEAGECADILKKHIFQGHPLDRDHLIEELGDVLHYIARGADALGVTLDDIAQANVAKLQKRYPDGFDKERSMNRSD